MKAATARSLQLAAGIAAAALLASACTGQPSPDGPPITTPCASITAAVSPEKVELFKQLAAAFEKTVQTTQPGCVHVLTSSITSGEAARLLHGNWPDTDTTLPKPTIWSPAATNWLGVANDGLATAIAPEADAVSFARTPLVFAMPKVMAQALGWPSKAIGYTQLRALATNPQGWASYGHPEWGDFRLGKTNPHDSTSGLNAILGQAYASAGKHDQLTEADVASGKQAAHELEASAVHYGPTTLTFLNNWYERDRTDRAVEYVSAIAVEEKSVIDYNLGNPDGLKSEGETFKKPNQPLVALYPQEGSLESSNPLVVVNATWITPDQKRVGQAFQKFVTQPTQQRLVLDYGFRPANHDQALGGTVIADNGIDPAQPKVTLPVPVVGVTKAAISQWDEIRKPSRVMILFDVSGSMETDGKLIAAIEGAKASLDKFRPNDIVGLRAFSTYYTSGYQDIRPMVPLGANLQQFKSQIDNLKSRTGTPLYQVTVQSVRDMQRAAEPGRINAIVLLTDGKDEDNSGAFDLTDVLKAVDTAGEQASQTPIQIFPIRYGDGAAVEELDRIAAASGGKVFDAREIRRIKTAFADAMSNF